MKKFLLVLMAALLLIFAAAAEDVQWDMDVNHHWLVGENGEPVDVAPHQIDGDTLECSICHAMVVDAGDTWWVLATNEHGDLVYDRSYSRDGELLADVKNEYAYDEYGNWVMEAHYENGVLLNRMDYETVVEADYTYSRMVKTTDYDEDGRTEVTFDENGDKAEETLFDGEGNVLAAYRYNYVYNDGFNLDAIEKWEGETLAVEVRYIRDEDGNATLEQFYEMGRLVREDYYAAIVDDWLTYLQLEKTVEYAADGTETVTYYDEYGEPVDAENARIVVDVQGEWQVDLNGHWQDGYEYEAHLLNQYDYCRVCGASIAAVDNVIYVSMFNDRGDTVFSRTYRDDGVLIFDMYRDITYNENGEWVAEDVYINGVKDSGLVYAKEQWDDGFMIYPAEQIEYQQDGGWFVYEMDSEGNLLAERKHLADGTQVYRHTCVVQYNANGYDEVRMFYDDDVLMAAWQLEYDEFDNLVAEYRYELGRLVWEKHHAVEGEDGFFVTNLSEIIRYHEDGTTTVTCYDEFGNVVAQ